MKSPRIFLVGFLMGSSFLGCGGGESPPGFVGGEYLDTLPPAPQVKPSVKTKGLHTSDQASSLQSN